MKNVLQMYIRGRITRRVRPCIRPSVCLSHNKVQTRGHIPQNQVGFIGGKPTLTRNLS